MKLVADLTPTSAPFRPRHPIAPPALVLNFAAGFYGGGAFKELVTFSRASTTTYIDAAGALRTAAVDTPRFDHTPATGEALGLLIEESRTNILLNSATLVTQSVPVTAQAYTLSFCGTGTVTLTGASTDGPLVGAGATDRVSLTFTPTAGSLTLMVSGSVTEAQLEAGGFPTSSIPTTSAAVTRAADVAYRTLGPEYNASEGTLVVKGKAAGGISRGSIPDTKGFWLADTDATALVGANIYTSDFATGLGDFADTSTGTGTATTSGSELILTGADASNRGQVTLADQAVVAGKHYVVQIPITAIAASPASVQIQILRSGGNVIRDIYGANFTAGNYVYTVQATDSVLALRINCYSADTVHIGDVTIDLADADRSVNANGLIVNGTVSRTPVATGAELMGYGGFSASNYLEQPYDADLDFGTGDFCVIGWVKGASSLSTTSIFGRCTSSATGLHITKDTTTNGARLRLRIAGTNYTATSGGMADANWHFVVAMRQNGTVTLWQDGVSVFTTSDASNVSDASPVAQVGWNTTDAMVAGLAGIALVRASATAPSADQIRRLYESERDYFAGGASFTIPQAAVLDQVQNLLTLDDGTAGNTISIDRDVSGQIQARVTAAGSEVFYQEFGAVANGDTYSLALGLDGSGASGSLNGGTALTGAMSAMPSGIDMMRIGNTFGGLQAGAGLALVHYYPTRLSDADLRELTA